MRYFEPFTPIQRKAALEAYRAMRIAYDSLRFDFRPLDEDQRRLVRQYHQAIMDFARALRPEDITIDVSRLNELQEKSVRIWVDYAALRSGPGGRSNE